MDPLGAVAGVGIADETPTLRFAQDGAPEQGADESAGGWPHLRRFFRGVLAAYFLLGEPGRQRLYSNATRLARASSARAISQEPVVLPATLLSPDSEPRYTQDQVLRAQPISPVAVKV
jgi:hypothetical protein